MKKHRAHHRYELKSGARISGKIANSIHIQLLTIGIGGCSFWVDEQESLKIKDGEKISCKIFSSDNEEFVFNSEVLYSYPFPHEGALGKCVGVKFTGNQSSHVQSFLEACEILESTSATRKSSDSIQ
ncbi:MAG: hypothetical protein J0L93_04425 [Deltaproteobacteria bacterium]|nr:hypothetical protein [Deltaproteobacteria bacterium]